MNIIKLEMFNILKMEQIILIQMKITTYFKYINVERARMLYTDLEKYLLHKVGSTTNKHHITQLEATVNILQIF